MKKISQRSVSGIAVLAVLMSIGLSSQAFAYTQITSQLDLGNRGFNVTNLQTFFADNSAIYPEGLVTGYFGGLTRASVLRFQAAYGIDQAGRVGPSTLSKINSLIASGGWVVTDTRGPAFYNVSQTKTSNSGTFSFNTDENTTAKIVYSTTPLMFNEGDMNSNGFGAIGGYFVNSPNGLNSTHSITFNNLQANTTYYYTVIATDQSGNVSVIGPNNTLRTNTQ